MSDLGKLLILDDSVETDKRKHKKNKHIKETNNQMTYTSKKSPNKNIDLYHSENKLITILKDIANPHEYELSFDDVVEHSTLASEDPDEQMRNIIAAYNLDKQSIMTKSVFGKRIDPNKIRIVIKNNVPEAVPPGEYQLRKKLFFSPSTKTKDVGVFRQTSIFIGGYGSYIINVPIGSLALAWKGYKPIILGPGPHVIHDPNLREVKEENIVSINSEYISHGNYHIIRVYPGQIKKIWIDSTPFFLTPQNEPYVFNESVFSLEQGDEDIIDLNSGHVTHGNYTIIQVPKGKVAKVWEYATTPKLLEQSDKPYVFTDPSFKFSPKDKHKKELFHDANERIILHGSIKRIMPRTGEVAITYNNGNLVTYGPNKNNEPIVITEINHVFDRFLPVNIQTVAFPSESTIARRTKENSTSEKDIDYLDVNYEVFRTSDGLPIGVKVLVVFKITDPELTLAKLSPDNIMPHIENLVVADLGKVVQNCSSTDFLKSNQQASNNNKNKNPMDDYPTISDFYEQMQQKVFKQLCSDFAEYGIELSRLNIETPKILDKTVSNKMAEFSLINTEANAKISVMDKNYDIAKREAEQEANKLQVMQHQKNQQTISTAQAEMEATKLRAESKKIEAETEALAQRLLLQVAEERAKLYDDHPGLLQYDLAQIQVNTMKGVSSMIVSPEVASMYSILPNLVANLKK